MPRRRPWLVFPLVVLVGVLTPGCAAATVANGSDEEETSSAAPRLGDLPEPPGSTLSYGGSTVKAGLGSYCWFSGGSGACVDGAGVPVSKKSLTVPTGSTMTFAYGGEKLDSLSVTAGSKKLDVTRSGTTADLTAELPVGEYDVSAFATMPEGDASYGFRIIVEEPGHLPETGGSKLPDGPR